MKDFEREPSTAEHDVDAASEASSEPDYNYEFAQMEVIMKTLNSNGKTVGPTYVSSEGHWYRSRAALKLRHSQSFIYRGYWQQGVTPRLKRKLRWNQGVCTWPLWGDFLSLDQLW